MKRNHPGCLKKTELRECLHQLNKGESHKKVSGKNKHYIQMQDYTDYTLFFTWPIVLDLVLVWGVGLGLGLGLVLGGLGPGLDNSS